MSVTVYSRLNELLRQRDLTVGALERHIDERFGILLDPGVVDLLMRDAPVRQADVTAIGAVAAALDVELGELVVVRVVSAEDDAEEDMSDLNPSDSRRLDALFDKQGLDSLSEGEQAEMRRLVAQSARHMRERRTRQYAKRRNISIEQARQDLQDKFQEALTWIKDFESNPRLQRDVDERAARLKATLVE